MLRGSIINYHTYNFTSHIGNVVFPIVRIPFDEGWKISSPLTHANKSPPFTQVIHQLLLVPLTELSGFAHSTLSLQSVGTGNAFPIVCIPFGKG
jgi:hypothetical protein